MRKKIIPVVVLGLIFAGINQAFCQTEGKTSAEDFYLPAPGFL